MIANTLLIIRKFFALDSKIELIWKICIAIKILLTIKQVNVFSTKELAIALEANNKAFISRF